MQLACREQVDAEAELVGPETVDLRCTLGQPCALAVPGYRLRADTAQVVVLAAGHCGHEDAVVAESARLPRGPIVARILFQRLRVLRSMVYTGDEDYADKVA